jgi:hypothetical protein
VTTFAVPPRWSFVRIETDDGLVGWGEAVRVRERMAVYSWIGGDRPAETAASATTAVATTGFMFVEEPVLSEPVDAVADVLQPDPSHCGGITEARKMATMAEAYDVALALHCPLGPIALAACLQIDRPRTTRRSRSRASASTTTRRTTCSTTSSIRPSSPTPTASWPSRTGPAWASR